MPSVVRPCSCAFLTTFHISAPGEGFWCRFFSMLLHAFVSLAANRCCLESNITGPGLSPHSLISAPHGVTASAPSMDLACQLRWSWRSSHLPTSLGLHQSSLPYCATACKHATWTALTVSGTMLYVLGRVRSLASAALALFMHLFWCSLNVRCASIHPPSQHITCVLNRMNLFQTLIFADSSGWWCFLWPRMRVNSAASVFAVSNCSPRLLAHWMLLAGLHSHVTTTWLT